MYSTNNMPQYSQNLYYKGGTYTKGQDGDRFIGTGLLAPLFLGGVAGYAIGYNRPNNYPYPYPMPYQGPPVYYNNYYYPYY